MGSGTIDDSETGGVPRWCEEAHGYKTESVCRRYAIVAEAITGVNKGESELHL